METKAKKEFKAPAVEHLQFEENNIIETSGNCGHPETRIDPRTGNRQYWDAGRQIWH